MRIHIKLIIFCLASLTAARAMAETNGFVKDVKYGFLFTDKTASKEVFAPFIENPPELNGNLDDPCWEKIKPCAAFKERFQNTVLKKGQTHVRIGYTKDALYFGVRCDAGEGGKIKHDAPPDDYDKGAHKDDCIGIFFDINNKLYEFFVGAGGARSDFKKRRIGLNFKWEAATSLHDGYWIAEVKIPFSSLSNNISKGDAFHFNIGRVTAPAKSVSSLFPDFDLFDSMGNLVLGTPEDRKLFLENQPQKIVKDIRFVMNKDVFDNLDDAAYGRIRLITANSFLPEKNKGVFIRLNIVSEEDGSVVLKDKIGPLKGYVVDFNMNVDSLKPGKYTAKAELVNEKGEVLKSTTHTLVREEDKRAALEGRIPLTLLGKAPQMPSTPIYAGIPAPRGSVTENTEIQVFDSKGKELPCQTETLARWSPKGSVKWMGLHFQSSSSLERKYSVQFRPRKEKTKKLLPKTPVIVTEDEKSIIVNTGKIKFQVLKSNYDGVHKVWMDLNNDGKITDTECITPDKKDLSPYVIDQNGKAYSSKGDVHSKVCVETKGPMVATLRAEGWFVAKDGSKICRYVTRLSAYAGLGLIKAIHTPIFAADSREVKLADIGFSVGLKRSPNASAKMVYRFGAKPKPLCEVAGKSTDAYLLQHEKDRYDFHPYSSKSKIIAACGKHAEGWVELSDGGISVTAALRDMWQNYPKELEAEYEKLTVHLWPRHGLDKPIKPLTVDNLSELWFIHHRKLLDFQVPDWFSSFKSPKRPRDIDYRYVRNSTETNGMGIARTSEMVFSFETAKANKTPKAAECVNMPAIAAASPKWMCDSGAFGPLKQVDKKTFPLIEEAMAARFDGERRLERFSVGMWNYGGSVTYFRPSILSYDQLVRPWRLAHHGSPRIPWLLFARSGDKKYFDYGRINSLRCMDIGVCHYATPEMERNGYHGKKRGGQCDYKGVVPWSSGARIPDYNAMTDYMRYYSYLTGNKWGVDVSNEWGNAAKKWVMFSNGRTLSGYFNSIISMYEATWDMDYRELAERCFGKMKKLFNPEGYFNKGQWYDYAPWLSHYYWLTGNKAAADMARRLSSNIIKQDRLMKLYYENDFTFIPENGYGAYDILRVAYDVTGDKKYLETALGCSQIISNSVITDKNSFYYGADCYSRHSLGGFFPQKVPYILPVLKKELKKLKPCYPSWTLYGDKIEIVLRGAGSKPLELRMHLESLTGRRKSKKTPDPIYLTIVKSNGEKTGPKVIEIHEKKIARRIVIAMKYASITLKPELLKGETRLIFSTKKGEKIGMRVPIQLSRPVPLVFVWNKDLQFGFGPAIYFQAPQKDSELSFKVNSYDYALTASFVDPSGRIVQRRELYPWEKAGESIVSVNVPKDLHGKIWCFLPGAAQLMEIQPAVNDFPHYFSCRADCFFVPEKNKGKPTL